MDRDGTSQRLLPRVVPVPGLTPQQSGAILVLYDVTDLARLDEMRSELVAVASHELQTPLTTLRMTLLMLQEAAAGLPARERELVATSLIGVEQLTETVHEFLDLTRIEAGELRLNLEPVHLPSSPARRRPARRNAGHGAKASSSVQRRARSPQRHWGSAPASRRVRQPAVERPQVHAERRNHHRERRELGDRTPSMAVWGRSRSA